MAADAHRVGRGLAPVYEHNWFVRHAMRRIAMNDAASADMTRDGVYTDWAEVNRLADELAQEVGHRELEGQESSCRAGELGVLLRM